MHSWPATRLHAWHLHAAARHSIWQSLVQLPVRLGLWGCCVEDLGLVRRCVADQLLASALGWQHWAMMRPLWRAALPDVKPLLLQSNWAVAEWQMHVHLRAGSLPARSLVESLVLGTARELSLYAEARQRQSHPSPLLRAWCSGIALQSLERDKSKCMSWLRTCAVRLPAPA